MQGEQRIVCIILGALNDVFNRISAWADSSDRRPMAVVSSAHRSAKRASIFLPVNRGASRNSASSGASEMNPSNCVARGMFPRQIISHLLVLIRRPVCSCWFLIIIYLTFFNLPRPAATAATAAATAATATA